jgi:hypothetical protein
LAARAIAASLAGVNLAAIGQQLLQRLYVLVVNIFYPSPTETALRLVATAANTWFSSIASCSFHCSHLLPIYSHVLYVVTQFTAPSCRLMSTEQPVLSHD